VVEVADETQKMVDRFLGDRSPKAGGNEEPVPDKPARKDKSVDADPAKPSLKVIKGGKISKTETGYYWVVALPSEEIDDAAVKNVAEALEMDIFMVRSKLNSNALWVVRRFDEADRAKKLVSKLLATGIDAHSITTDQLNETPPPLKVKKVSLMKGGLRFEGDSDEDTVELRWSEAFLIVSGRIRRKAAESGKRKRKKTESRPAEEMKDYEVTDIYPKKGRGIRVAEGTTDFSGLGKYMTPSSLLNLNWLQRGFENASSPILDDGYRHIGMVFRSPAGKSVSELMRQKEDASYLDNSRHFDEYSTLVQLHYRKIEG